LYDFGDVSRAEMLDEVLRLNLQKGSKGIEDALLLAGRVARMVGNLNQAQHMLEGFLRKSETAYGLEHIRMLDFYTMHNHEFKSVHDLLQDDPCFPGAIVVILYLALYFTILYTGDAYTIDFI